MIRMQTPLVRKYSTSAMTALPPADNADDREPDLRLVERAQAGEMGAFEELYRREVGRVYALCLRLTSDTVHARELTQTVFVKAWDRLGSFRGDAKLSSWLHRIAVNEMLVEARSDRRRRARVTLADDSRAPGDHGSHDPGQNGAPETSGYAPPIDSEARIDLERAIAALPPGARTVFVLHDIHGYKHEEISRMTGSAEGTLRAQLHRARKLLMEALSR